MRFGYWIKDLAPVGALTSPRTARLRRACPNVPDDPEQRWMAFEHRQGGSLMVYPGRDGAAVPLEAFGQPVDTFDGMVFYPPRDAITPEDTIKPEDLRGPGGWYATTTGKSLWIPIAAATPRELVIVAGGGYRYGSFVNEFGLLAHELYEAMQSIKGGISFTDQRLWRLLTLAIQGAYALTDELIERCTDWFSSRDVEPIAFMIFGLSPKALAAARAGSASAVPTTQTSQSRQAKRRRSTTGSPKRGGRRTSG